MHHGGDAVAHSPFVTPAVERRERLQGWPERREGHGPCWAPALAALALPLSTGEQRKSQDTRGTSLFPVLSPLPAPPLQAQTPFPSLHSVPTAPSCPLCAGTSSFTPICETSWHTGAGRPRIACASWLCLYTGEGRVCSHRAEQSYTACLQGREQVVLQASRCLSPVVGGEVGCQEHRGFFLPHARGGLQGAGATVARQGGEDPRLIVLGWGGGSRIEHPPASTKSARVTRLPDTAFSLHKTGPPAPSLESDARSKQRNRLLRGQTPTTDQGYKRANGVALESPEDLTRRGQAQTPWWHRAGIGPTLHARGRTGVCEQRPNFKPRSYLPEGGECGSAPRPVSLTRTFHVVFFSGEALLRLASFFLPPELPSKKVKKSLLCSALRAGEKQIQETGRGGRTLPLSFNMSGFHLSRGAQTELSAIANPQRQPENKGTSHPTPGSQKAWQSGESLQSVSINI